MIIMLQRRQLSVLLNDLLRPTVQKIILCTLLLFDLGIALGMSVFLTSLVLCDVHCFKKRGVKLSAKLHQLLIDFENSFTVGNSK